MTTRDTHPRKAHTLAVRVDPLAQDRLQWIIAALEHVIPDIKTPSQSTIMRRALHNYVNYLGNIIASGRPIHPTITAEAAALSVAKQNMGVYWPNGLFPVGLVVKDDGTIQRFDLMEKDAKQAHAKAGLDRLLDGGK